MTLRHSLPKLAYIGDVPVESSYHGSALLFRLLEGFPAEKLLVVEGGLGGSVPERRLPGVRYDSVLPGGGRLLTTRARNFYTAWLQVQAALGVTKAQKLAKGFGPEAVLTVMHGYSWLMAARLAARLGLPLHIVCHDDLPRFHHGFEWLRRKLDSDFGAVYRQAASRFCVSPFMRDAYLTRYGAEGVVLYPSRGRDCPSHLAPPARVQSMGQPFTVAYGGTINSAGIVKLLVALAAVLAAIGGRLLLFGPYSEAAGHRDGLEGGHVRFCGLLPSNEWIARLREEADLLFLPIPFDEASRPNMEIHFPSKLTDYTAAGLPILIQAPPYSSATRWAKDRGAFAEIVETDDEAALGAAILRLYSDPQRRFQLGARSLEVGSKHFALEAAQAAFHAGLVESGLSRPLGGRPA